MTAIVIGQNKGVVFQVLNIKFREYVLERKKTKINKFDNNIKINIFFLNNFVQIGSYDGF